jgi:hypothetical protein
VFGIDFSDVLVYLAGAVSAAIVILKVVAPRTKTTKDDAVLDALEKVRPYLPAKGEAEKAAPVDAVSREKVRDHRDEPAVEKVGFKTK